MSNDHSPLLRVGFREGPHPTNRIYRGAEVISSFEEIYASLPGEVPNDSGRHNPLEQFAHLVQQAERMVAR